MDGEFAGVDHISWPRDIADGRSGLSGGYHPALVEHSWPRTRCDRRPATIHRGPKLRVALSGTHMLSLSGYRRDMSLTFRGFLFTGRTHIDPTVAAVVADAVHYGGVVNNRRVVNVVDVGDVYIVHRAVVEKPAAVPTPAFVAVSKVAVTVVDPAVEADTRTPIAFMENKSVAAPTPIGWSPEKTRFWRQHPCTRHPEVVSVIVVVGPVPRCPDIAFSGTQGLLVNRKGRRADPDRYAYLGKRSCRHRQHYKRKQQRTNGRDTSHSVSSRPLILRLPGGAQLLRVAWIDG